MISCEFDECPTLTPTNHAPTTISASAGRWNVAQPALRISNLHPAVTEEMLYSARAANL